jgi:hypothetical protein
LIDYWCGRLGKAERILETLAQVYPESSTKDGIAAKADLRLCLFAKALAFDAFPLHFY